ncbi:hypothetical protein [Halalkalirubrum salinum]|uniref:hypothetical protein n=1 Tax=Halalkalirubrum salinum TaxID=2563889 RepID=UPI001485AA5E|nr:hypothetical protein [Halalkalirubrum salinum]
MHSTPYNYEIEFDVIGTCRQAYEQWLAENSMEWFTHEAVATFDVWKNDKGMSPEMKFIFGFESLEAWAQFVNSECHLAAKDKLKQVVTELNGTLWERGSIRLDVIEADQELPAAIDCNHFAAKTEESL